MAINAYQPNSVMSDATTTKSTKSLQDTLLDNNNRLDKEFADLQSQFGSAPGGGFSVPSIGKAPTFNLEAPDTPGNYEVYKPDFEGLEGAFQGITDSYDAYKGALQSQHQTGTTELKDQLDYLLGNINDSRTDARQDVNKARGQIMEDSFDQNRALQAQMSARGLSGSGMEQMGNIQQRMAQGESISELTNSFLDYEKDMITQIDQSQKQYNTSINKLNDSLQSAMAQIMSQEASTRMDYEQMVQGLERQVIADANQALDAQRQYDMQIANYNMQKASFEQAQYEFQTQAKFQQASLRAQSASMAQSAFNNNREFALQLKAMKDSAPYMDETDIQAVFENPQTSEAMKMAQLKTLLPDSTDAERAGYLNSFKKSYAQEIQQKAWNEIEGGSKAQDVKEKYTPFLTQYGVDPSTVSFQPQGQAGATNSGNWLAKVFGVGTGTGNMSDAKKAPKTTKPNPGKPASLIPAKEGGSTAVKGLTEWWNATPNPGTRATQGGVSTKKQWWEQE